MDNSTRHQKKMIRGNVNVPEWLMLFKQMVFWFEQKKDGLGNKTTAFGKQS